MIKTGINFSALIKPELLRLLANHPDIDLQWVAGKGLPPEGISAVFDQLQGELKPISRQSDLDGIDLYIGHDFAELQSFLDARPQAKAIVLGPLLKIGGYEDGIVGVCEFNRKAMVRGGRIGLQPDIYTLLGAMALMPLAKNLLLNSTVSGTMIVPSDNRSDVVKVPAATLSPLTFKTLRNDILQQLQTSFQAPIEINKIEVPSPYFACAALTLDIKIDLNEVRRIYDKFYSDHRHVVFPTRPITDAMVLGTNKTVIGLGTDGLGRLMVTVAFDARYKEAGNVVHMLNLLFGLDELTGF